MHCREAGYSSPDNQYAAAGPRANYRASNPLSVPSVTCEDADEVQREEEVIEQVVDKTKKKEVRFLFEGTLVNESYTLIVTRSQ